MYIPYECSQLIIREYKRTREQDDELGLLDIKTENYTADDNGDNDGAAPANQ